MPVTRDIDSVARLGRADAAVLFLLHASPYAANPGGTENQVLDCVRHLKLPRALLVYPSNPTHVTVAEISNGCVDTPVWSAFRLQQPLTWYSQRNAEAETLLVQIARTFGAAAIVVEHVYMWPLSAVDALRRAGFPYVYVAHDFFAVCPSLNLGNPITMKPCTTHYGGADDSARCLHAHFSQQNTNPGCEVQDLLRQHQSAFSEILNHAEAVVFPSESVRERVLKNVKLDVTRTHVIPHGYPQPVELLPAAAPSREVLRVALMGMLAAPIKGSDLIIELLESTRALPLEWHIFGVVDANNFRQRLEATGARLVIHGSYERATIIAKLRHAGVDVALFTSIAEETFSFTLSEAWCAGIPPIVPKLGALQNRVESSGLGWLIEPHSAAAAVELLKEFVVSRAKVEAMKEKLKSFRHLSLEDNAAAYLTLLKPLRIQKRAPEIVAARAVLAAYSSETAALGEAFKNASQTLFSLNLQHANGGFSALNQVEITASPDGLNLVSSGNDPHFTLPEFSFAPRKKHLLRVEISAPFDDVLQLFYSTQRQPGFSEPCSLKGALYKGRNELYLPLDARGLCGPLRLDPGTNAGTFVLHALEVRAAAF